MLSLAPYPYDSILINGRDVLIRHIISTTAIPQSAFETNTFNFIRDWFSGVETFGQLTSGSTGNPKEIRISRDQMMVSARMTEEALGLYGGWYALLCLSPSFIAGKMMLVRSFITGMKVVAVEPSANPFLEIADDQRIDFSALVPSQVYDIVRSGSATVFNRINTIIIGGAALDAETSGKLQRFSCRFYATYGMTETISHIALKTLNGNSVSDYYTTLPGISISQDRRGCLVIDSNHLPEKVITNDLVEIVDLATFQWLGRWDNVINSGGLKVIPERLEIEIGRILQDVGIYHRFFVSSIHDQKFGNKIVLLIEHAVSQYLLESLQAAMKKNIPVQEVPKEVICGNLFVYTANGKIDRTSTMKHITDYRDS